MSSSAVPSELFVPTPSIRGFLREAAGLFELPRLVASTASLRNEPRGDGSRVIVLPGFGANDRSTWPIRRFLRSLGYVPEGWGLGVNRGQVPEAIETLGQTIAKATEAGAPRISLVGWSLGGYIAREVARDHPDGVRGVVTLGSPVVGGPKYTTVSAVAGLRGWDLDEIEAAIEERKQTPLRVPVTAIYSRRDGVVAWPACVDPERGGPIEHVEVDTTHVGLGFNIDVYRVMARRLAESGCDRFGRGAGGVQARQR